MRCRQLTTQGFTIVEGLVGITVTVMLLMVIMNFMANYFRQHAINNARSELLASSQRALDVIGQDIRLSASADQNNRWQDPFAPSAPDNQLSWQSNSNTLVLATAAEDDAGNILFADVSQYISEKNNNIFFVTGGKLFKRSLAAPVEGNKTTTSCPSVAISPSCPRDNMLAENVSGFIISYLNGDEQIVDPADARAVELSITLSKDAFGEEISAEYTTRMVFRND